MHFTDQVTTKKLGFFTTVCGLFRGCFDTTSIAKDVTCGHCVKWVKKNEPDYPWLGVPAHGEDLV